MFIKHISAFKKICTIQTGFGFGTIRVGHFGQGSLVAKNKIRSRDQVDTFQQLLSPTTIFET